MQNAISQGQWVAFATYRYDERGNLASATDADGHASRYEYDEDHRLTLDQERSNVEADAGADPMDRGGDPMDRRG